MRKVVVYPDEILTTKAEKVEPEEISTFWENNLFNDMLNITINSNARGIAAPQLGIRKRIIFILDDKSTTTFLINPVIVLRMGKITSYQEGCLSLPDQRFDIKRAREVVVEALDGKGNPVVIRAKRKITSIVLQHEIDHLDGILILDRKKKSNR